MPLVKAMQEQQLTIEKLQKEIKDVKVDIPSQIITQQTLIGALQKQMAELKNEMESMKKKTNNI